MAKAADVPWPEHPRPDFQRTPWLNLNGPWAFDFDPNDVGEQEQWFRPGKHAFSREITIPFPWESRLSGIGDTEYQGVAWYSREITLPTGEGWDNMNPWLVIGACDWEATVWVNGDYVWHHTGGYVPIEIDLSDFARPGDKLSIVIKAKDPTDPQQPTGKQIGWYTRTSGIWQTVYVEPRPHSHVRWFQARPNVKTGEVMYFAAIEPSTTPAKLTIESPDGAFEPVTSDVPAGDSTASATVTVPDPRLWSPGSPTLYNARLTLTGEQSDRVDTYFGLREISIAKAPGRDYQYIFLNDKPVYLRGALHQSFHPEGIHQYPDDATMRRDYELCKEIGLNFIRIHIKTPVPRELYWADRLGVLIMQDVPNYWKHTEQAQKWWEATMRDAVARDFNHPAVFAWCDFNETWGIGDGGFGPDRHKWVEEMVRLTKKLDPTRLVEDNSPCNYDHVATDINSWHFYINDYAAARGHVQEVVDKTHPGSAFNYAKGFQQADAPLINSEYGGISAGLGDQDVSWCFKYLTNELRKHDRICGYVYTELSDIEWEHNGFVNYDRSAKTFGYDFWHPGMTLADLNAPDFIVIDAPPMIELKPGDARELPIAVSHWSHHQAKTLQLRWRLDGWDRLGIRTESPWQNRPAAWKPFQVTDQPPIELRADDLPGLVGALLVQLTDGEQILARNYVNVEVDRGPTPTIEAADDKTLLLRFSPADFAEWSFQGDAPKTEGIAAHKIAGRGYGAVEYHLKLPDAIPVTNISGLAVIAELAAVAGDAKLDWPARKKDVDYPQTDVKKWPSDVVLSINGTRIAEFTLEDDPADARGALSHHRGHQGSFGYLTTQSAAGEMLQQVIEKTTNDRTLRVRFEVPADADHPAGLAVFGEKLGCFPVPPTIKLTFNNPHGLGETFISHDPITTDKKHR